MKLNLTWVSENQRGNSSKIKTQLIIKSSLIEKGIWIIYGGCLKLFRINEVNFIRLSKRSNEFKYVKFDDKSLKVVSYGRIVRFTSSYLLDDLFTFVVYNQFYFKNSW